jgi:hypothetical protein
MESRIDSIAAAAPDIVLAWRGIDAGALLAARREVRRRAGGGSATAVAEQLAAVSAAFAALVRDLPAPALAMPGGEQDWNVAQAIGHACDARAGLAMAGALAATGRWPADPPVVVPGVPGPATADRDALLRRIAASARVVDRAARSIAGHETEPCPLVHPLVGKLRCGEWLLFAGVHDLMHLDQLERLESGLAAEDDR